MSKPTYTPGPWKWRMNEGPGVFYSSTIRFARFKLTEVKNAKTRR